MSQLWPETSSDNPSEDDNIDAFLDFDSDGDTDLLIGSLTDPDRLLMNDGSGKLKLVNHTEFILGHTRETLGIALAGPQRRPQAGCSPSPGRSSLAGEGLSGQEHKS